MDTQSSKFKVKLGLFVAGGFVLFVIAIFLIGRQKHLFDPVFKLTTTFFNVSGLQAGNNVRFSGINVGTVESIILINDTTVQVGLIVKKSVQKFIKSDCQAAIGSEGIIGDRVLIITQGSSAAPSVRDDEYLISVEPVETDAIISSLHVTAGNFEIISGQLSEIMIKINQGKGTMGRLIQDSTISENINQTIINLRKSSKGLNENMEAAKSNFLLRGYYNKKEKQAEKAKLDSVRLKEENAKKKTRDEKK
jgi:phospholipid/cholesterol/gamma-HCH transport system substrate-binding protein